MPKKCRSKTTDNFGIIGSVTAQNVAVGPGAKVSTRVMPAAPSRHVLECVLQGLHAALAKVPTDTSDHAVLQAELDRLAASEGFSLGSKVGKVSTSSSQFDPSHNTMQVPPPVKQEEEPTGPTDLVHKPRIFIGSSSEGLNVAEALQHALDRDAECTVWNQGVFAPGFSYLENLVERAVQFDFAILVLTPDDVLVKRQIEGQTPRDNVLFELGLFMGVLGRKKTFMLYCRDDSLGLPSDLLGIVAITFPRRSDGNLRAALGPACAEIKVALGAR